MKPSDRICGQGSGAGVRAGVDGSFSLLGQLESVKVSTRSLHHPAATFIHAHVVPGAARESQNAGILQMRLSFCG